MEEVRRFAGWPHVLRTQQFSREDIEYLFNLADKLNPLIDSTCLLGKKVAVLFGQPSTRTYWSFIAAATKLGAQVYKDNTMMTGSSLYKDESIEATIDMLVGYNLFDLIVMRMPHDMVYRAASISSIPIINGGAGTDQHPTQAFLDVYTILKKIGRVDGIRIAMIGDLKNSRTVHSLAYLLTKFKEVKMTFVSPGSHRITEGILEHLREHHFRYNEVINPRGDDLETIASENDVLYVVRPQSEQDEEVRAILRDRFNSLKPGTKAYREAEIQILREIYPGFCITQKVVDALPEKGIIHHPLPNTSVELPDEIINANDSRKGGKVVAREAAITYGLKTRQALLKWLLLNGR